MEEEEIPIYPDVQRRCQEMLNHHQRIHKRALAMGATTALAGTIIVAKKVKLSFSHLRHFLLFSNKRIKGKKNFFIFSDSFGGERAYIHRKRSGFNSWICERKESSGNPFN